jgi:hypothetical protein
MLKTVSSITNSIGALNYKGTWNATTNTPTLASGVGTKGDYYVVSVAGSTALDGISNWGVGDWAAYNGSAWQRVEGGANLNGVDLSVSGTSTLSGLTASTALALDASKNIVSVTNTGTGNNVLATAPTLVGNVSLSTGNLVMGTSGKGIDFSATSGTGTSELLNDYEEGTFTPTLVGTTTDPTVTYGLQRGTYTKVGRMVSVTVFMSWSAFSGGSGNVAFGNLPFTVESSVGAGSAGSVATFDGFTLSVGRTSVGINAPANTTYALPKCFGSAVSSDTVPVGSVAASGAVVFQLTYST